MIDTFHKENFIDIIDELTARDPDLARIVAEYGYPPFWTRPPEFQSLVLFILEQQVSLASAFAAFTQLKNMLAPTGIITPEAVLTLTDEELRACYFSRQKTVYVRELARAILDGHLVLHALTDESDDAVREKLKTIKGIGDWTVDVYLIFAMQRSNLFPLGDIALVNSLKFEKDLARDTPRETLAAIAETFSPYKTLAAMILWHAYIERKGMKPAGYAGAPVLASTASSFNVAADPASPGSTNHPL